MAESARAVETTTVQAARAVGTAPRVATDARPIAGIGIPAAAAPATGAAIKAAAEASAAATVTVGSGRLPGAGWVTTGPAVVVTSGAPAGRATTAAVAGSEATGGAAGSEATGAAAGSEATGAAAGSEATGTPGETMTFGPSVGPGADGSGMAIDAPAATGARIGTTRVAETGTPGIGQTTATAARAFGTVETTGGVTTGGAVTEVTGVEERHPVPVVPVSAAGTDAGRIAQPARDEAPPTARVVTGPGGGTASTGVTVALATAMAATPGATAGRAAVDIGTMPGAATRGPEVATVAATPAVTGAAATGTVPGPASARSAGVIETHAVAVTGTASADIAVMRGDATADIAATADIGIVRLGTPAAMPGGAVIGVDRPTAAASAV
ncbi:hypothetical protein ACN28C_17775 [Plantactinospora sp. WMMC1484]|uniref:hypothetical protein n=1 Tax=Plantactinospora sp. WMMC1484 TaxID=3404122 RepID=UPI003BF52092